MDLAERQNRRAQAQSHVFGLVENGIVAVATTFVDNSGITRVKTTPTQRLPELAAWGVGASTSFDVFRFDDLVVMPPSGEGPVGDSRVIPDLSRLVALHAQPGWAWAPGERYNQEGQPHEQCSRLLLRRMVDRLAAAGLSVKAGVEIEWSVSRGDDDAFQPATAGPAYGMTRLTELSEYCRDIVTALEAEGIEVLQLHPEYGAGQFEISTSCETPVSAADTSVLARSTIRAVGHRHDLRTSYSAKVLPAGVGNGGHVHLSLWRDEHNLMSGGGQPYGLTDPGASFTAGILARLPGLLAVGAPGVSSYLRLVPSHWAGAYACWGLENREAAVRMIMAAAGSDDAAANIEVKCFDLQANPYLLLSALLAAGLAGIADNAALPEPLDVDPAALSSQDLAEHQVLRLPETLEGSLDAFLADEVLTTAFGSALVSSIAAVRRSEIELFAGATPEEVTTATRWAH